ncbi:FKBP-type peptidyl-prolyl cis-trans isomerase [Leifsonia sp. 1010]|uniref:FKBP-type peptidyl-prolyl cis-trans isomerase n=1 Tax=Leifsonia sp. 1010 TaxID=2817769 RepID=UPI00285503AF|nr:FKBP-type peptidyl-prolyl cis-trans isomerase [Leifsonia sp. 1010]MDR6613171.1 peptidylprolyl isomerase [Leifsonia sp. 1010]
MRTSLKALTASATAALLVAGLAACSSSSEPTSSATPAANTCQNVKSGATSKSVKVSGEFGADPKVEFSTPLKVTDTERSVVITGKGEKTTAGQTVGLGLAAYNGTTGKPIAPSEGYGTSAPVTAKIDEKAFLPGFVRAAECLPVGSRAVLTTTAEGAFGQAYEQLGVKQKDPVVIVTDVRSVPPAPATRATGKPVAPTPGLPTVKLNAKTGEPSITIPKSDPPKETKIALLKEGDGETVQKGDTVSVQYKGVLWRNGQMFDSSWSRGEPASFQTTGVIAGFTKALEGQKVGSQVLAVIPPADGYGAAGNGDITGTDTIVFVIDILSTSR